ncbi:MAG: hypothetical protein AAF417_22795 [Pseudomonadota bacterium]
MAKKRYALPRRFNAALSETAYEKLRELNGTYGYGNNYLLTVLLENLESIADERAIDRVFADFASEYGSPEAELKR